MVALQGLSLSVYAEPDFSINIHGFATGGLTDRDIGAVAVHEHDPNDDFTLQAVEVELGVSVNEYIHGFVTGTAFTLEGSEGVETELEEAFIQLKNLPLGFEIRGGRYFNKIGFENNVHLHGWDFVNSNLSTGVLLGEEGLRTDGVELSWEKEYSSGAFGVSASYGEAVLHGEEEGEEHDLAEESLELAFFSDDVFSVRPYVTYNKTDYFQHKLGVSAATGDNGFGRDTNILGADYTFTWRENGLEAGGKAASVGVEYFYRDVEFVDEDDASITGDSSQNSFAVRSVYTFNEHWSVAARYEYIDGVDGESFTLEERQRASLAVTYRKELNDHWGTHARLQYNHDKIEDDRSNNVFLQLGFSFGAKTN